MPSQASINVSLSHFVQTVDTPGLAKKASQPASQPAPRLSQEHFPICGISISVSYLSYLHCSVYISFAHHPVLFFFYVCEVTVAKLLFLIFTTLLVGDLSCRYCTCCRIDNKDNLKHLKAKCLKPVNGCILVLVTHDHHTSIHEESKPAGKSLSDPTKPKKNTALVLVSCSLASFRQKNSPIIFHCGECLLLPVIQIPCAKSRHPPTRSQFMFFRHVAGCHESGESASTGTHCIKLNLRLTHAKRRTFSEWHVLLTEVSLSYACVDSLDLTCTPIPASEGSKLKLLS